MSEPELVPVDPVQEPTGAPESVTEPEPVPEPSEEPTVPENGGEEEDDEQGARPVAVEMRTPEEIQKSIESWERAKGTHFKNLEKRDEVRFNDTVECPLCEGLGRMWPVLPEPEQSARRDFIMGALGGEPEAEYRAHPTEVMCEQCDGWGRVYTGSKVANQDLLPCPACQGMGHRPAIGTALAGTPFTPTAAPTGGPDDGLPYTTVAVAEQFRIGNDAWGRPPGNPHYAVPRVNTNAQPAYAGS